ncbi:hypothetical protein RSOLAG1IB_07426 [Rhizoctonia solani AG-1 IB]|uniref:Uncharacterized protein n=1 Tax=Thanatephorus cucumeris (strain AG1-IB / isolate 7/3/14) TaxID=1108050 RepID=A0A0B7FDD3_THACB|nr:hypothetical protein RSOLAG1IB_07426 [Rhizoctonia solani AG-1 IB]
MCHTHLVLVSLTDLEIPRFALPRDRRHTVPSGTWINLPITWEARLCFLICQHPLHHFSQPVALLPAFQPHHTH